MIESFRNVLENSARRLVGDVDRATIRVYAFGEDECPTPIS